ncbi:Histidine phosphatase superfamily,clade-2-containing protein [Strongyloides ratti]|uniref:Histidine phosphatase superfamily,clade-2-containing protein n=1 Tax=Strongyloides ratti TaxID=34506 RepID=A0A090MNT0_STRRB|nr:Histidine phosphatase superfamily,clade-2-containing protein [Strongyloides ratti]CEF59706.1 Histidine phosphatase superfamily,clade-2-containing protein [Strongyloides ratti]
MSKYFIILSSIILLLSLNFIINEVSANSRRYIKKREESVDNEPNSTEVFDDPDINVSINKTNLSTNETIIDEETKEHDIDHDTVMLLYVLRHGNRNPSKYFEENSLKRGWGEEGPLELNRRGKNEVFNFGVRLRHFLKGFTKRNFNSSEINLYTSSANRCQMTLQLVSAAIFRPIGYGYWRDNLDWSPTPYTIDDNLLRPYTKNCDAVINAWATINNEELSEIKNIVSSNQDIINFYINEGGKFNFNKNRSFNDLANVADNLHNYKIYRKPFPEFITKANFSNYNSSTLIDKTMTFIEGPQIACANDKKCGYLMGGNLLSHIKNELIKKANETHNYPVKMIGYASHTEIVLSVMKLMGIDQNEVRTGCGFIIQLREKPFWSLKILTHNTIYQNNRLTGHSITIANYSQSLKNISMGNGWIGLQNFTKLIQNKTIDDWEKICPTCSKFNDNKYSEINNIKISGDTFNPMYDNLNLTLNFGTQTYPSYNILLISLFTIIFMTL